MKNVDDFCEKKGVRQNMKEAFVAYMRSDYALKFMTRSDGETTKLVVNKMNEEELQEAWVNFTADFKKFLESSSSTSPSNPRR